MKTIFFCVLFAGNALASAELDRPEATIGTMEVKRSDVAGPDRRQSLELQGLDVSVEVHGDVAQTRVEHDFYNDSDERLEGTFRFPLPIGAEITGLSMEIDGRMVDGELLERKKAERIFDQVVDEMRDPALLTWESGNVFKLRVFPIEPSAHKRVVIRYLSPLEGSGKRGQYAFHAEAAQLATHIGHFRFTIDGKTLHDEARFSPKSIVVEVPQDEIFGRPLAEEVEGTSYLRLQLPVAAAGLSRPRGNLRWVLVADVSRSALEARQLTVDAVRAALAALPAGDQFTLLACDISCRESASGFLPVTGANVAQAARFLESIDFDGATDLGAALRMAASRAHGAGGQVLYIGDGNPTWGVTEPAELGKALEPLFAEVPLHAVLVGKDARPALLQQLSARGGGLLATPLRKNDLAAFARSLGEFGRVPRIHDISLSVAGGAAITPSRPPSIAAGETLTAFVRSEKGHAPPASVHLHAILDGKILEKDLPVGRAVAARDVARRFAGARIRELELEGGHDVEVLSLSLAHQVLCSKTAWLVLENDEAYRKNEIERHQMKKSEDPTISGKDLESTDGQPAAEAGGEGPEPELWLLFGLMGVAFAMRRKLGVAR